MQLGKRTRSLVSWLICVVILAGSFASAARLRVGGDRASSSWIEVCTASGMKFVSLPQDGSATGPQDDQTRHHLSGHCAWCSTYSAAMGMPPSLPPIWQAPVQVQLQPFLFLEAPRPLFAWASAQPRAPPRRV